jgi:putative endonuclease
MSYQLEQLEQRDIGKLAEDAACRYLQMHGFTLIDRNYQCKIGEIDLIMQDKEHIVFVEVRHRESNDHGSGLESIDKRKMNRIIRTATLYLQDKEWLFKVHSRFDVISMFGPIHTAQIEWIKNAFTVDY